LKGTTLAILGFFAFLAGLNAVNAIVLWTQLGPETMFEPYLIGSLTGELSIATYLLISILATFVFLGTTLSGLVSKLPDPTVLDNIVEKVNGLENDQKALEKIKTRLMIIDAGLNDIRKGFLEGFSEQNEDIKKIRGELSNKSDKKLGDFKEDMTKQLVRIEKAMQKAEQTSRKSTTTISKQTKEIPKIKSRMENLEKELVQPKPQLSSQSELKKVKGIGIHLTNDLRGMGIASVGELILTDPMIIAQKTGTSQKTVEKLQGRAQLLMVPGIKGKDIALLEDIGITTRKKLAEQDPVELGMKMNGILKAYVEKGKVSEAEKPTVEEISSWIKFARS
jgi:predicted flap endonuclease-1-like 5' DNA nuclease